MTYWIAALVCSILTIIYFERLSKKNVSTVEIKGTLLEKTFMSARILGIFGIPFIISLGNIEFFFLTFTLTVSIAMISELVISKGFKTKFNFFLILLVIVAFIILPHFYQSEIVYKTVFMGAIIIASMDTFMNVIGVNFVSKLPKWFPVFKYPDYISGNKTGLSVILSLLLNLFIFSYLLEIKEFTSIDIIIISLLTAKGDGVFSYYKRINNIDDYSNLLGKVGGFCDRFDGWVLPFIYIFLR